MTKGHLAPDGDVVARQLALSLDAVADRLDAAGDATAFVKAVEANGVIWGELARVARTLGWPVPQRMVEYSVSAVARARHGINDDEVEALIRMNRSMSRDMSALAGNGAVSRELSGTTLWHDWMERRLCGRA